MEQLRNNSDHVFVDISSEVYRQYRFSNGTLVLIDHPVALSVSASGGHRIFDGEKSHYVPSGWVHLSWEVRGGEPHFVT